MNNKYTEAQKQSVLELFANGNSVSTIVNSTGSLAARFTLG